MQETAELESARSLGCLKLSDATQQLLACPRCKGRLSMTIESMTCLGPMECGLTFPIVDGIPILLDESKSIFSLSDFCSRKDTFFDTKPHPIKRAIQRLVPSPSVSIGSRARHQRFVELLLAQSPSPRVLVIGGSQLGKGMEQLTSQKNIDLVESDISFGARTALVCDGHDLPFEDGAFDGVIVQAVLEHVVDPYRCVAEIHRVLRPSGLVYAATPFMQQVHAGRYDFTRFTHLGHRRLFRRFEEVESGAVAGPGTALVWSIVCFMGALSENRRLSVLLRYLGTILFFWVKYFDYLVINRRAAFDSSSAYYILARRSEQTLSDRELLTGYRGAQSRG